MDLIAVQSSNISQIGFQENEVLSLSSKSVNVLRIVFKSGNVFDYYNVERDDYERFLDAKSKGQFFHQYIKNIHPYEKVS